MKFKDKDGNVFEDIKKYGEKHALLTSVRQMDESVGRVVPLQRKPNRANAWSGV